MTSKVGKPCATPLPRGIIAVDDLAPSLHNIVEKTTFKTTPRSFRSRASYDYSAKMELPKDDKNGHNALIRANIPLFQKYPTSLLLSVI
jgi:hypothetical protein